MNILILIKLVSELSYVETLCGEGTLKNRLSGDNLKMNPSDRYALELAIQLKDLNKNIKITAMTMGPMIAKQILSEALALGADTAIHISDAAYAGSDTVATSTILSNAIKLLPKQDLILCGAKSIDSETGHVGPQIASLLNIKYYTNVLSFSYKEKKVAVHYLFEEAIKEASVPLPVLLTVINGTSSERIPTIKDIRAAKGKHIKIIDTKVIPPVPSFTETIEIIETPFSYRNGKRETDISKGVDFIINEICI